MSSFPAFRFRLFAGHVTLLVSRVVKWCAVVASLLVLLPGCGKPLPPGKVKVNGVVELDGSRLHTGVIHFFSQEGSGADSAASAITPHGSFSVVLSPGDYRVAVIAQDGINQMDDKGKPIFAKSVVAERYASTKTSGLTVSVAEGSGPVTIAVKSQ